MAFATRTLRDTNVNAPGAGGNVTILLDIDNDTASNTALDADGLDGFANGAKLDIARIQWGLTQGTAAANTGDVEIKFKGASSDTTAIRLAGTGYYDGSMGLIKNNATNTTATSSDILAVTRGTAGFVLIELRKDVNYTDSA